MRSTRSLREKDAGSSTLDTRMQPKRTGTLGVRRFVRLDSKAMTATSTFGSVALGGQRALRRRSALKKTLFFLALKHLRNEGHGLAASGGDSSIRVRIGLMHGLTTCRWRNRQNSSHPRRSAAGGKGRERASVGGRRFVAWGRLTG